MCAMVTNHGGAGHPLGRGLDILTEDPEYVDTNNESTYCLDATVAVGAPEAVRYSKDSVYSNQDRLTTLT